MSLARLSACMLIFHKGHTDTIQVYSVTVMTHVKALQAGHSSQGTSEPITPGPQLVVEPPPQGLFSLSGEGGMLCYQSLGPEPYSLGVINQETTVTSNIALAETMTNLIGVFIVAWDDNAFSVLNAEQPVFVPIGLKLSTGE